MGYSTSVQLGGVGFCSGVQLGMVGTSAQLGTRAGLDECEGGLSWRQSPASVAKGSIVHSYTSVRLKEAHTSGLKQPGHSAALRQGCVNIRSVSLVQINLHKMQQSEAAYMYDMKRKIDWRMEEIMTQCSDTQG